MARIRTIKPEFWQNETLALLPEHARLLAIALLNHSDDEGYFLANVALVRASCFPFDDDSTNVRRSLDELSSAGYIEVVECAGKTIGRICKFKEHQRIDRPQKSKLSSIFIEFYGENADSTNVRRMIDEQSSTCQRLEQGTGNREQGKEQGKEQGISLSKKTSTVSVQEFFDRWNKFACKTPKLKSCRALTPERKKKIQDRLKDENWFKDFLEAVASLPLGGDGWQPSLDWLVKNNSNAYRILEGDFDWRSADDPAAIALAKRRRQEAYEQREEHEKLKREQNKAAVNGLHKAIENTLPVTDGTEGNGFGNGSLFEPDATLFVSGAELSSRS